MSEREKLALAAYVPRIDLDRAILHEGRVPWYLAPRFCAIVRGRHVYLRAGVYDPDSIAGLALLGHELTHVTQYRTGMNAWRYLLSALRGYAMSPYEKAAFAVQARITRDLETGAASAESDRAA